MKFHPLSSSLRLVVAEALIITLVTLLFLPSTTSATLRGNVSPRKVGGRAVVAAPAPLVGLIGVNTTSDADNLDPNTGCDTDAATPGEQCSLRAAIQRANVLAGDDEIDINIPSTQPNCDPTGAHCTINLTKTLPDLSTNIRIISQGIDKVTVRRNSATEFAIFRIVSGSDVTLSGLRLTNGKPFGIAAGGAVAHDGTGIVNIIDNILVDNIAVGVTVQNVGGVTANNVKLTTGTLTQPATDGAPLPQNLGNLAPGQWATRVITFAGTNNPAGQKKTLTFGGTYTGGTFTDKWKVTLP